MDVAPDSTFITEISQANSPLNSSLLNPTDTLKCDDKSRGNFQPKSAGKFALPRSPRYPEHGKRMENKNRVEEEDDDPTQQLSYTNILRIIKLVSLVLIGACALFGMVCSKITFVSISSRMYNLYSSPAVEDDKIINVHKSTIFFQLVFILVIPEILCLGHCLLWGFIGKSSKNKPWPSWKAIGLGLISSVVEVIAICGFVFGVACKLPPSLTILLLNGVFWVVIARHLIWDIAYKRINHHIAGYRDVEEYRDGRYTLCLKRKLVPLLEGFALLLQLSALVAISILLTYRKDKYNGKNTKYLTVCFLIPITLTVISVVWSGWLQKYLVEPRLMRSRVALMDENCTARLKSGLINSFMKIIIIPFVAYGYAHLLLDFKVIFSADSFHWTGLELDTFLTHIFVSFVAYLFLWVACALQAWAFFIPMLLSTPISFVWYIISVETNRLFPFIDEYFVSWNLQYAILVVAALLWLSQILAFGYYVTQNSDNILTNDADLFWTPRYNGVFLEQYMLLNRKTDITGYYGRQTTSDPCEIAKDSHVFICSTMYHENEVEMKQMLKSISRIDKVSASESAEHHKYESHIFFDSACSGEQLNQWAMQLLGLLESTLGVDPAEVTKLLTPYGMQLRYKLKGNMPFYIHLKDNSKVKNKKRWSQVMYINYILNYRIEYSEILKDKAFILTTDADIDFTSNDVVALLDILACDDGVGAVCARTHPLGSGPVVWYQIFDYAIGHWFQKAAEHILGCVLCCPGCFSVFRVSALEQILDIYSSSVENGFDFLTKDMGEDRWLCTLLIKAGWRLEYSAVSQDSTFCPETFEEFYKQRRRWVPSTVANLALVISSYSKITSNNDSISILFILYQFLLVFSTLISPATVILIIVTGLTALNENIDEVALIIVLCIISFLYGVVCVYATEKTQLVVAKILTLIFSIIMAVVVSGILTNTISTAIEGDPMQQTNQTFDHFRFPVDISAVYSGIFAATYIMAGILHFNEISCLFHFIWYLLCLPSGYLFLTIYSACNINNRSWGTRELMSPKSSSKSGSWVDYFLDKWYMVLGLFWRCIGWKPPSKADDPIPLVPVVEDFAMSELVPEPKLSSKVKKWLKEIGCEMYADNFEKEGYTELDFIASMKMADFIAIGVGKRGFRLKLENEVKKLSTPELSSGVPHDVEAWLHSLKLGQYKELFESEGYCTNEDVENLKGLTSADLQSIGITRRAHLHQLLTGLRYLQYPSDIEILTNKTRIRVEQDAETKDLYDTAEESEESRQEYEFWLNLAENTLKPESANLGKVEELKEKLRNLRNLALLVLLLTNIMWIVFLYTLVFPQLTKYNLPDRAFSLFFLAVFSIIVCIQFIAMIFHRFITLVHLLARTRLKNRRLQANWFEPSGIYSQYQTK